MSDTSPSPPPPPSPSPSPGAPPPPPASSGIPSNVAAALSYFVIVAIVWLILEPYNKDKFIRFHSIQAIGLAVVSMGVSMLLGFIPILGWILLVFMPLVMFVVWVICIVKAYQNQWFKLPVLGDFALQQAEAM